MIRLLLVDDERNILNSLFRCVMTMPAEAFPERPHIESFTNPREALKRASETAFDLVISDYRMPELDGVEFLEQLIRVQPDIARLILSGYADMQAVLGAINRVQIFRFITKPWEDLELQIAITQAIEQRSLRMENQRLADLVRLQQGRLSRQELELHRLEQEHPGITRISRAADGSIDLELDLDFDPDAELGTR